MCSASSRLLYLASGNLVAHFVSSSMTLIVSSPITHSWVLYRSSLEEDSRLEVRLGFDFRHYLRQTGCPRARLHLCPADWDSVVSWMQKLVLAELIRESSRCVKVVLSCEIIKYPLCALACSI